MAGAEVKFFGMQAKMWYEIEEVHKLMYLQGLFDGLVFSGFKIHGVKISTNYPIARYIHAIDEIYSDSKNAIIPVPFVLEVVTLKFNGASEHKVEYELIIYRKHCTG